jgi:hypothetical protein
MVREGVVAETVREAMVVETKDHQQSHRHHCLRLVVEKKDPWEPLYFQ